MITRPIHKINNNTRRGLSLVVPPPPYTHTPMQTHAHTCTHMHTQAQLLPRHMVYRLSKEKHDRDVKYLLEMERAWVGQAVIARKDKDGFYYPGGHSIH